MEDYPFVHSQKYWTKYNTQKEIKRRSVRCGDRRLQTIQNETERGTRKYTRANQHRPGGYLPAAYPVSYSTQGAPGEGGGGEEETRGRIPEELSLKGSQ